MTKYVWEPILSSSCHNIAYEIESWSKRLNYRVNQNLKHFIKIDLGSPGPNVSKSVFN